MNFKEFITSNTPAQPKVKVKQQRKGKSEEIVRNWQNIKPTQPIQMQPVDNNHHGTKFKEDGLRLTGSLNFITSVLSNLKDMLKYNSVPGVKLDIEYREAPNKYQINTGVGKKAYVFYAHITRKM